MDDETKVHTCKLKGTYNAAQHTICGERLAVHNLSPRTDSEQCAQSIIE